MKSQIEEWQLIQRQQLPFETKIRYSEIRIRSWYEFWKGDVFVSFSGGKDSTVLLHLVRKIYPNVPAVFSDTGLEYPEIRDFVETIDNVVWLKPKMNFKKVLERYGYPIISRKVSCQLRNLQNPTARNSATRKLYLEGIKRDGTEAKSYKLPKKWTYLIQAPFKCSERCCEIMKVRPLMKYQRETGRKPFIGTMASDSLWRKSTFLRYGCNTFGSPWPKSTPLAIWLEADIWKYIREYDVPYSKIYDLGARRTGCLFCMFGVHLEKEPNRFQQLKQTHPKLWDYCINKLELSKVLDFIKVSYE